MNPTIQIWIEAARPKTLWACVAPVMLGTAMAFADGRLHLSSALLALLGAFLLQVGTNYSNDYFDFVNGADNEARLGPRRATQAGLVKPEHMRLAFIITYALAFFIGVLLAFHSGWIILLLGAICIASGFFYTGGPKPLGYLGLGDLFVFVFFGPVAVAGTYYVQALEFNPAAALAGVAPGLISTAILAVNNLRDIQTDEKAGKHTLVVRFGLMFGRMEYALCLINALLVPVLLFCFLREHGFLLLSLLIVPFAATLIRSAFTQQGVLLNPLLGRTGFLLLLHSILFSIGWVI